ncbi:MAG: phosphoribosyltransferase domain-containing protein [Alphaproteobacteria bacterium]|nr:phosphoribosyltransferase domain-containing protein [Alphaproteobacteria bacterium]
MQPELFYLAHERFLADVEAVARRLETDSWRPDFLVGIGRGGLVPAAYLSHRTGIPMLSVDHSSGEPGFADELLAKLAAKMRAGLNILIVDDINDSGTTIAMLRDAIAAHGGIADRLRVAVLINNTRSRARADYWSEEIDRAEDKRWFVFPWEAVAPREELVSAAQEVPERLG